MNGLELPKIVRRPKKRLGRGHGSGKVKTSGRGTKGQKARGSMPMGFEGGQLSLIKRLPLLRGKGKNASYKKIVYEIQTTQLNQLPKGTRVTLETLRKNSIITKDASQVKIIGGGQLTVQLTVEVPCSAGAGKAIEKAGGTIVHS